MAAIFMASYTTHGDTINESGLAIENAVLIGQINKR